MCVCSRALMTMRCSRALTVESRASDRRSGQQEQRSSNARGYAMSVEAGADSSPVAPAGIVALGVPANSDALVAASAPQSTASHSILGRRNPLPLWRLLVVGGWALFLGGFALGEPAEEAARHWWVDGAWTITYLATTLLSLWAALALKGRDRSAWGFFALSSGVWLIGQLVWDYYELIADIVTPFPAISDLFYLLFAPLYTIGLMLFGERPKGASLGPKLVSQLVMIGAAVYVAVGLQVSEAIVAGHNGPLYVATSIAWPLL